MTVCPQCSNPTEDTMTFCPICGVPLNHTEDPSQTEPSSSAQEPYQWEGNTEKSEEAQEQKKQDGPEKQEKVERGFLGYLIGGLILITFGVFAVIQISSPNTANTGQNWAIMLLLIGIIIITSAVYMAVIARRHPRTTKAQNE
ncbi:MAG: zinc ribbon domain-containing protein [Nitrososphaerota archaeon]|nr:zinc ribbon domain-containing protein [Nitrososphaerota archaeon]